MKDLSKGTKFAFFTLLLFAIVATAYGVRDISVHGDHGGSFYAAGGFALLAGVVYFLGKRTDKPRA
ncbi:LPXTG cell wall anchor domain-containing protein [Hymenobacter lapidiphilus]|uniref:LPXTG cell wall anchor domain-containing protein n=1 Tax=Hymenobacter lapidiphilus TaxID=2608003 RepID=A0A7Y7U837_9BACT|nr:LPXTG cell wall anchor domain-containing protein [Hymenobacter lapidiphilus]NVO33464.1 LPXTG cell wall anchor domain-containing protein [Hymenobacter lapidiphilus]